MCYIRGMNKELLTQLKEAGFPFVEHDGDHINEIHGGLPYSVTLSELISVCRGDREYFQLEYRSGKWIATTGLNKFFSGEGNTPEEAVAKLWLKIIQ